MASELFVSYRGSRRLSEGVDLSFVKVKAAAQVDASVFK